MGRKLLSAEGESEVGRYWANIQHDYWRSTDVNIGRGRVLLTTSFEHVWAPICKWFGVDDEKIEEVLPNAGNFDVFSFLIYTSEWASRDVHHHRFLVVSQK